MRRSFHWHLRESLVRMWSSQRQSGWMLQVHQQSFCPAHSEPPPLHAAPPCTTISPVHSQSERRVGKKRRKNAQQPEERKEKMRRGLLNSGWSLLFGLMESVQLPEWLKLSLFNDFLLIRGYVKSTTEWILLQFCDMRLFILVPIYSRRVFWGKYELRSWKQNHNHCKWNLDAP